MLSPPGQGRVSARQSQGERWRFLDCQTLIWKALSYPPLQADEGGRRDLVNAWRSRPGCVPRLRSHLERIR